MVESFRRRFEEQGGVLHLVHSFEEAAETLRRELERLGFSSMAVASCGEDEWRVLRSVFEGSGIRLIDARSGVSELERCEAGLTFPVLAVAETGSILEVNSVDADRLASSLPIYHAAFLRSSQVVGGLTEAASALREASSGRRFAATFISGPSRTADIEMQLVLGVHGPKYVHVFLGV